MLLAAVAAVGFNDCASSREVEEPKEFRRVELPQSGELEVRVKALAPVGEILPVEVSITNLAERERVLKPFSVVAIRPSGERINEISSLEDPRIVSGGAALLQDVSGGKGVFDEALIASDATSGLWPLGGPIMWFAVGGNAAVISRQAPSSRLRFYWLETKKLSERTDKPPRYLAIGQTVTGDVFLPNGQYEAFELTVHNQLSGYDEVMTVPWNSGGNDKRPLAHGPAEDH